MRYIGVRLDCNNVSVGVKQHLHATGSNESRRKLKLKAKYESGPSLYVLGSSRGYFISRWYIFSFRNICPGAFKTGFIGSTGTALPMFAPTSRNVALWIAACTAPLHNPGNDAQSIQWPLLAIASLTMSGEG